MDVIDPFSDVNKNNNEFKGIEKIIDDGTTKKIKKLEKSIKKTKSLKSSIAELSELKLDQKDTAFSVLEENCKLTTFYYILGIKQSDQAFKASILSSFIGLCIFIISIAWLICDANIDKNILIISTVATSLSIISTGLFGWISKQSTSQLSRMNQHLAEGQKLLLSAHAMTRHILENKNTSQEDLQLYAYRLAKLSYEKTTETKEEAK